MHKRPEYLSKYLFDWELLDVVVGGKSTLDANSYLAPLSNPEEVTHFLQGYGFDLNDPVSKAELFGIFQEAVQFIKRYFLKEGNPEGLDLILPSSLYSLNEIEEVFITASGHAQDKSKEEKIWCGIILKVMHTIVHADKDLRTNYFSVIQQQIFDRFYKVIVRDAENKLFLGTENHKEQIALADFQTKAKKSRDSVIIKLLHKAENVAEELFDRIGVRIVTYTKLDCIRVINFLHYNNVILAHNIKPSRSQNSLMDFSRFRTNYFTLIKTAIRNNLSEENYLDLLEKALEAAVPDQNRHTSYNKHTSAEYRSIQFTCRQMIQYKNPVIQEIKEIKKLAKNSGQDDELVQKVLALDLSKIARDIRFFYPFEVQIMDLESYKRNTEGEASHQEYKKAQLKTAMIRIFRPLLAYKNIELS